MIDISQKKVLFLGYGAVAKCVWSYFDKFFLYDVENIIIVDKFFSTIKGPKIHLIPEKNIIIQEITSYNFESFLLEHNFSEGDIVIDLTVMSNTYHFIHTCFILGINYINTSIEDMSDKYLGTSIDYQQQIVHDIYQSLKKNVSIRSNILIEFGQNPGLIQHYILYALNEMNKLFNNNKIDDYSKSTLLQVIDNYKIGTIFCSEIDNITICSDKSSNINDLYTNKLLDKDVIYNTWSVGGLLVEGLDKTELVHGGFQNTYIKPEINPSEIFERNVPLLQNENYKLLFLNNLGINNSLNSICPDLKNRNEIEFIEYEGKLIHHGEVFELAKYFGKKSPFMSYVYKLNKYANASIQNFIQSHSSYDTTELFTMIKTDSNSFKVFDNIDTPENAKFIGNDSIGCTIYCGDETVERIFWCGSILSDYDDNVYPEFTPTIVQVAAGLLSGLSFILEPENTGKGLFEPCDLDTKYIIDKSIPYLGKFFFTEIPIEKFSGKFKYSVEKII
jgi:hypothetical protein